MDLKTVTFDFGEYQISVSAPFCEWVVYKNYNKVTVCISAKNEITKENAEDVLNAFKKADALHPFITTA